MAFENVSELPAFHEKETILDHLRNRQGPLTHSFRDQGATIKNGKGARASSTCPRT